MARRLLLILSALATLAASAVTVGAHAQGASSIGAAQAAHAVRALQAKALVGAGFSPRAVKAATALTAGALILSAGDMSGDGVDEVIDARYHAVGEDGERLVVFCRDGRTGAVRWRKIVPAQSGHVYVPGPQLLGPQALPGVVIVDIGAVPSGGSTLTVSLRLLALDDKGIKFWSHYESGTLDTKTNAEKHVPLGVGVDTFQNSAEDWLVGRYDSPGGDNAPITLTPVRVRGKDGLVVQLGAAVTSPDGVPSIIDVPDLSGDALPDVVLVVPGTGDGTGVFARHGVDGSDIWSNTTETLNPTATATGVGDVHASADGSPPAEDVAINTGSPTGGGLGLPLPIPDPTAPGDHGQVALLDGASGTEVWVQDGDFAYPVLQAGSPLKPAVGVYTTDTSTDSDSTTATTTFVTYDDSGKQIYTVSWKATTKTSSSGDTVTLAELDPVGDFEPDGSVDGFALITVSSGDNVGVFTTLFHGADGTAVKSGNSQPLGGSVNGQGDDLVTVKTRRGLTVSVFNATGPTLLFSKKVAHSRGMNLGAAFGTPIHSSSTCADVLVAGQGPKHSVAGVLTAKGALEWVVRYVPGDKAPGTIYRPTTRPTIPTC
jgi:hypothetical protein